MKRIVTMQDISCVGKCSLTVALPILSAMGIETSVIPTAVLSTHTMFEGFTFRDLTNDIEPIMEHWHKEHFDFKAVYTGYLGSTEQIAIAKKLFNDFGKDGIVLVDPCMADHGKLYPGFTNEFVSEMKDLCKDANIICPNITEACLLLDIPYMEHYTKEDVQSILKQLTDLGCDIAVLTGISYTKGQLGASFYDKTSDTFYHYETIEQVQHFHGTGDIFASVFLGCLLNNLSIEQALQVACDYVSKTIAVTLSEDHHNTYGVNFEWTIPWLASRLEVEKKK